MQADVPIGRQEQIEKLKEIGALLSASRHEKGISLEEVATKTQIRLSLLKAIELGQIENLPEPVYLKGLLKQFADNLGLNGKEIANSFPLASTPKLIQSSPVNIRLPQVRSIHLYFLYILLVFGSVNYIAYLLDRSTLKVNYQSVDLPTDRTLVTSADRKVITVSSTSKKIDNKNSSSKPNLRVGIALKSASWIRVVADGKTQFEGVMASGQKRTWTAKQQLTVNAKNAGGVMVALNDEKAKQLGQPGKPKEITFDNNRKS
jgi:cytoskeletal protein RodZ